MRFTAQEEYGLRCMLQLARAEDTGLSIPQLASLESLTPAYVGKLMRVLRQSGLVTSTRGKAGGYALSRPARDICILDIIEALDGQLYSEATCGRYTGTRETCVHSSDCSLRALWSTLSTLLGDVLTRCRLSDLVCTECIAERRLRDYIKDASG